MMGFGEMEEDPFFGSHMRTVRQMNNMMNSLFADPFGMMTPAFDNRALVHPGHHRNSVGNIHNSLMSYGGFPDPMQNINRLLTGSLDSLGPSHSSFSSSSTVVSMTSGPDGNPHVYKATSSTRVVPGGVKETQSTVCDSRTGTKKMSIGHHIGERAHIVEREQNMRSGDQEERQDFINLEEEEADEFNREWESRTRSRSDIPRIGGGARIPRHNYGAVPALTAGPSRRSRDRMSASAPLALPRRTVRSSPLLALPSSTSSTMAQASRTPYTPPGYAPHTRKHKTNIKTVSGSPPPQHQPTHDDE
ncbi:myeloid leukemia factor-like isoform X1 [Atheta coriaria]